MIYIKDISTEYRLLEILTQCGYTSEHPSLAQSWSKFWGKLKKWYPRSFARHLTDDGYTNLFVVVEDKTLIIYHQGSPVCELQGGVSEEQISEKIELAAQFDKPSLENAKCLCLDLPLHSNYYEDVKFIGVDETNSRFGQVTLKQCRHCKRYWLYYFVDYHFVRKSLRYFMGLITLEVAKSITPETAVDYLESLEWHLYGGGYFDGTGKSKSKYIPVDPST
ncbi:MAG: hypothetical protein GY797_11890 [Deltaproteobacteria bacterium]|nr:hypothetical protein [Deltaproteobacteria bacterium]